MQNERRLFVICLRSMGNAMPVNYLVDSAQPAAAPKGEGAIARKVSPIYKCLNKRTISQCCKDVWSESDGEG